VKFDDPTASAKIAAAQKAKTDEADRLKAEAEAKAKAEAEAKAAAELAKKKSEFEAAIKKGDDALALKSLMMPLLLIIVRTSC
jgi:membrane protein involved in colicin uptake